VQFGVTEALTAKFVRHDSRHSDADVPTPWFSLEHTFVMEGGEAKLPRPPIR
jgi:catechol 1,2-dioxygenase